MLVISIHIVRTSRQTKTFMDRIDHSYGTGGQHRAYTTAALLNRTLRTVVWFPITPVMSLWFNSAMIITRHFTQKAHIPLEFINISLFSLMTIFMAAAFFFNPMVIEFLHDYRKSWSLSRRECIQGRLRRNPAELTISISSLSVFQPTSKTGT
ncbi:hypothetical protein DL89DRAFT_265380 [Linderina pennispora]|uniref:Uncharacterized protein n=1 Tax=Linderina pennispora TaxID=61395 RepID=A0A1Y1WIU6_9FUNG|nr:uncharacterized protein DL89DRAFT_265380 [Linderina pennispora]ORX73248.1 hypothetical protein DL89DRAFT_265380 [Linderina pennispora]